jgi:hypothetical protein
MTTVRLALVPESCLSRLLTETRMKKLGKQRPATTTGTTVSRFEQLVLATKTKTMMIHAIATRNIEASYDEVWPSSLTSPR